MGLGLDKTGLDKSRVGFGLGVFGTKVGFQGSNHVRLFCDQGVSTASETNSTQALKETNSFLRLISRSMLARRHVTTVLVLVLSAESFDRFLDSPQIRDRGRGMR